MQPLLALATLGDGAKIVIILFVLHRSGSPRQVRSVFSRCKTSDSLLTKFASGNTAF
jgi:hypothetical protein